MTVSQHPFCNDRPRATRISAMLHGVCAGLSLLQRLPKAQEGCHQMAELSLMARFHTPCFIPIETPTKGTGGCRQNGRTLAGG